MSAASLPLALYVHMPWCVRKCPYCDFNSHQLKSAAPDGDYIDALIRTSSGAAALARPQIDSRVLRRRHAEPVRARGFRALARGARGSASHSPPMPR
jgi:hypothetical protein